jgi:5-methylcytosine-specific restriction endonuclease McrA
MPRLRRAHPTTEAAANDTRYSGHAAGNCKAIRSVYVIGHPCALCGEPAEHLDHVTPLSRGGADHPSNWQALCSRCNLSKGDS